MRYKNYLVPLMSFIYLAFIAALLYVPFMRQLFLLQQLPAIVLLQCIGVAFTGTMLDRCLKNAAKQKIITQF